MPAPPLLLLVEGRVNADDPLYTRAFRSSNRMMVDHEWERSPSGYSAAPSEQRKLSKDKIIRAADNGVRPRQAPPRVVLGNADSMAPASWSPSGSAGPIFGRSGV
jgi:hypothetical protein